MRAHSAAGGACLLAAFLVASLAFGGPARGEETGPSESLFLVELTTGPAWRAGEPFQVQPHAAAHSANLRRLREDGTLVLGARHGSKGMVILRSGSEAAARTEIEKDPAIAAGVFVYTIEALEPFYGGCVEPPQRPERPPPTPSDDSPGAGGTALPDPAQLEEA
jgi:uncharacterized protein YciI